MRAALESLLRVRKLDVTLTHAAPWNEVSPDRLAPTGCDPLDAALHGGLRRGHLSEIVGGMGIVKVDLLGLGMMAVLQDALEVINSEIGGRKSEDGIDSPTSDLRPPSSPIDLAHLPPNDPAVYRMTEGNATETPPSGYPR